MSESSKAMNASQASAGATAGGTAEGSASGFNVEATVSAVCCVWTFVGCSVPTTSAAESIPHKLFPCGWCDPDGAPRKKAGRLWTNMRTGTCHNIFFGGVIRSAVCSHAKMALK